MKWVPLVVKTSDRLSSSSLEETPYGPQLFCFRARFQTLFVHIVSPTNTVRSSKNYKVAPYMKKSRPG